MEVIINNQLFFIDEFAPGQWFWSCRSAESEGFFDTACEAQQDAINYVQNGILEARIEEEQKAEERKYGAYEKQGRDYYNSTRR